LQAQKFENKLNVCKVLYKNVDIIDKRRDFTKTD